MMRVDVLQTSCRFLSVPNGGRVSLLSLFSRLMSHPFFAPAFLAVHFLLLYLFKSVAGARCPVLPWMAFTSSCHDNRNLFSFFSAGSVLCSIGFLYTYRNYLAR